MTAVWRCNVCVDFDGVIHSYTSGWKGPCIISDPPVEGAFEWLEMMAKYKDNKNREFRLSIYSSRSKYDGAVEAMQEWFKKHGLPESTLAVLEFPTQKPAANLTIDDRAFCFEGTFPQPDWVFGFKSWNKRNK